MHHVDYCGEFLSVGDTVLDVGSGRGDFLCGMAQKKFLVSGIEYNPDNVVLSLDKARERGVVIDVRQGQAECLPFSDNSFDFVNCSEVTEHVGDPERVCREIFRVLKPNGRGYISFTNRYGIYDCHFHLPFINFFPRRWAEVILRWLKKSKSDSGSGRQTLQSMHYFTYHQAVALLKCCGFTFGDTRVVKIKRYFGGLAPIPVFFYGLFARPFYFSTFHFFVEKTSPVI